MKYKIRRDLLTFLPENPEDERMLYELRDELQSSYGRYSLHFVHASRFRSERISEMTFHVRREAPTG